MRRRPVGPDAVRSTALAGVAVVVTLALTGCSDDGRGRTQSPSNEASSSTSLAVDPPLPNDLNPIPYRFQDLVALGDWQLRLQRVVDPAEIDDVIAATGTRLVAVDLSVRNGALEAQTIEPDVFVLYDDSGQGVSPIDGNDLAAFIQPVKSDASVSGRLVFAVPNDAVPSALLFRGTERYGAKVLNGLVALDPEWEPTTPGE